MKNKKKSKSSAANSQPITIIDKRENTLDKMIDQAIKEDREKWFIILKSYFDTLHGEPPSLKGLMLFAKGIMEASKQQKL